MGLNFLSEIGATLTSIGQGLGVTLRNFAGRKPITVQYPDERLELPERARGYVEFIFDQETGEPLCTGCLACERICPTQCIQVGTSPKPEGRGRQVESYVLGHDKCMLCSLCIEACPVVALVWNEGYERSTTDRSKLVYQYVREKGD